VSETKFYSNYISGNPGTNLPVRWFLETYAIFTLVSPLRLANGCLGFFALL